MNSNDVSSEVKDIKVSEIEAKLRIIVTTETIEFLSKRSARHELEKSFGLSFDALKTRRGEINQILEEIVSGLKNQNEEKDESEDKNSIENESNYQNNVAEESRTYPEGLNSNDEKEKDSSGNESSSYASSDTEANSRKKTENFDIKSRDQSEEAKKLKLNIETPPRNLKKIQSTAMSVSEFLDLASPLPIRIGENHNSEMTPRKFGPGSCGWYYGGKLAIPVGEDKFWCQIGVNCTVLGSKEWPQVPTNKKRKK